MLRRLLMGLCLLFPLAAQTAQVTVTGPGGNFKPKSVVNLTVGVSGATGTAAIQGSLQFAPGYTATCTLGAAEVGKTVTCSPVNSSGLMTYVIYGLNSTSLVDGTLLQVALTIPTTAPAGTLTVSLSNLMGASPTGFFVGYTAGSPFTLNIGSTCDVTNDGKVDSADVILVANQIANRTVGVDLDGDNLTTIVDLMRVVLSALGGTCQVGP